MSADPMFDNVWPMGHLDQNGDLELVEVTEGLRECVEDVYERRQNSNKQLMIPFSQAIDNELKRRGII